jgi:integrase
MYFRRKPNSKFIYACWKDLSGKTHERSTRTTDQKLAERRGRDLERAQDTIEDRPPTQTLEAALEELVSHKLREKRSAATLEITRCKVGHLLRVLGRRTMIDTITPRTVLLYLDQRRTEEAHDHTIAKEVLNLLQALRIARGQDAPLYHRDPKTLWPKALNGHYEPRDDYWTLEQYHCAQEHGVVSRRDHVTVYCHTGCRYSELYRIEASDLDEVNRQVQVRGTKTKRAKRWVPVSSECWAVLRRRAQLYPTGTLFPDRWSRSRLVQDMKKVAKRAGVPRLSANGFRHTFCTWCGEAEVEERVCAEWMGHTSTAMIRRIYQHITARRSMAHRAKFAAFLSDRQGDSRPTLKAVEMEGASGTKAE